MSLTFLGDFSTCFLPDLGKLQLSRMPSRESYNVQKKEKPLVEKAKQEASQEDILATALGMRMGPQKTSATFWQPIKILACSQLSSLVRRATLRDGDWTPKSEKVHNFKVRLNEPQNRGVNVIMCGSYWASLWEMGRCRGAGWKTELFRSVQCGFIKRKSVGQTVDHCC